jgi:D-proline reductase (dithiol) PrdB
MTSVRATAYGFAASQDVPIPYLKRVPEYYRALGYGAPYRWGKQHTFVANNLTQV